MPTLTALENITLLLDIAGRKPDREWLDTVIDTVGLRDRLTHRPSEPSGGQQQRVACARALAEPADDRVRRRAHRQPDCVGRRGARLLRRSVDEFGQTIVMVTTTSAASYADRVLFLADGASSTMHEPTADAVLERMKAFEAGGPDAVLRRRALLLLQHALRFVPTPARRRRRRRVRRGTFIFTDSLKRSFDALFTLRCPT